MKSYAGIGSRNTPPEVLQSMEKLGAFLATKGYVLRSGAAPGADQAFERGCDQVHGKKEIYVPWEGFENNASTLIPTRGAAKIAKAYHPNFDGLSQGAKRLQARNSHQVLGQKLDDPASFIVCYTKGGKGQGGTGQAIRIAKDYHIPVFDYGKYKHIEHAEQAFNEFYKEIRKKERQKETQAIYSPQNTPSKKKDQDHPLQGLLV